MDKWSTLLPQGSIMQNGTDTWENLLVSSGEQTLKLLTQSYNVPEWLVVDGGALHPSTTASLKNQGYAMWGIRGTVSVWTLVLGKDHLLNKYDTLPSMVKVLMLDILKRARRAGHADGKSRFKVGTSADYLS